MSEVDGQDEGRKVKLLRRDKKLPKINKKKFAN